MNKSAAAVCIAGILVFGLIMGALIARDHSIHVTAFENGYEQDTLAGADFAKWRKVVD